jgi:hypothetical protein
MAGHQHKKRRQSVKQEPDTIPKPNLGQPPEIIDLTGDD